MYRGLIFDSLRREKATLAPQYRPEGNNQRLGLKNEKLEKINTKPLSRATLSMSTASSSNMTSRHSREFQTRNQYLSRKQRTVTQM